MAKFEVNFVRTTTQDCYCIIEADDYSDARWIAEEMINDAGYQSEIDAHLFDYGEEYEIGEVVEVEDGEVGKFFNF